MISRKLLEKYLQGECTVAERKKVMKWLKTPEGGLFLEEFLDEDIERLEQGMPIAGKHPSTPDPSRMLAELHRRQDAFAEDSTQRPVRIKRPADRWLLGMKAVAAVLVVGITAVLYATFAPPGEYVETAYSESHYETGSHNRMIITLDDGSRVTLNHDSELLLRVYKDGTFTRAAITGEAYFEIEPRSERLFQVYADEAVVEVLGTSFNVRNIPEEANVQVSVVEGSVSIANAMLERNVPLVVLEKGQNALYNTENQTVLVENFGAENYAAWQTGYFVFENTSLDQICVQLERIYDVSCEFSHAYLREIPLTSNFRAESSHNTFSVIARSMSIDYRLHEQRIVWMDTSATGVGRSLPH